MKTNTKTTVPLPKTHPGAFAARINTELQLRRSVLSCLLWEKEAYEGGETIASRISKLALEVKPHVVADLAIEARHEQHLRHVPLLLLCALIRHGGPLVAPTIERVVSRPDELTELVSIYWRDPTNKRMLPAQMKKGLELALRKFDEYSLSKYNRDADVHLRDVLFLIHANPKGMEGLKPRKLYKERKGHRLFPLWQRLANNDLATADTWEVALSSGGDKKESWTRLITEDGLGYMALLKNLRNMQQVGVDDMMIRRAILARKSGADKVLPFRYVAAARATPQYVGELDQSMLAGLSQVRKLPGKTVAIIDVSGSMQKMLSAKSDMTRLDAACALGAILRELCEYSAVYATAGSDVRGLHATKLVPAYRGMALVDAIAAMMRPLGGGGIFLKQVMDFVCPIEKTADRIVVITDEQDCGIGYGQAPAQANAFGKRNYLINVASAKNGIGYGEKWHHIDGWSEHVVRYIAAVERAETLGSNA